MIGALAWIPILGQLLYRWLVKPELEVVLGSTGELGFTTKGTILNLDVAVRGKRKAALITKVEISLQHEQGRTITLLWNGLNEKLSQAQSSSDDQASYSYSRTTPAIAVQVLPETEIRPVQIRFDDVSQRDRANVLGAELARRITRMGADPTPAEIGATDEYQDLQEFFANAFQWEAGTYDGSMRATVSELSKPVVVRFRFRLSEANVDHVRANKSIVERYLRDLANKQQPTVPVFNWLYPTMEV